MKRFITSAAIAALISAPLSAQSESDPAPAAQAPQPAVAEASPLILNGGIPVKLIVAREVNSSTVEAGDTFPLTVDEDVRVGQTVVIPRGTPATAEITWRTGKGAFGKSGKLEFSLRSIDLDGQRIPVTGDFRQEGEGNTVATGVGVIAIGVFAGFITGKRARLPIGRELMAQIAQPVPFTSAGKLAPSFDSKVALAAADAKTALGQCRLKANALPSKKQKGALEDCFTKRME